jgi:hypothetical protein
MKKGMRHISTFAASFAFLLKDSSLVKVPGKRTPFARINPAAPAIIMEAISIVP